MGALTDQQKYYHQYHTMSCSINFVELLEKIYYMEKKKGTPHIKDTTLLDFRCKNTNWILFSLSSVDLKNCSILNKKQHNFGVFQILLLEENLKTCMPRGGHIINETNYRLANAKNTLFSSTFTIRILPNQSETPLATQFSQNYSFCKIQ